MKSIRVKIIGSVLGIAGYLTVLMWLFLGIYFLRDPSYLLANPVPFWSVALSMMILAGIMLFFLTKPISRVQKILDKGDVPTEEQSDAACRALGKLPIFILSFKGLAFFVGPALSVILGAVRGTIEFSFMRIVYSMLFSGGIGLMAGIQAIFLVNLSVHGLRARLKMYQIDEKDRRGSIRKRQILIALSIGVFVGGIFIGMGYGYLSNPQEVWRSSFIFDTLLLGSISTAIAWGTIMTVSTDEKWRLIRIHGALRDLTRGELINFKRIEIIGSDEIGQLTDALNRYMDKQESSNEKIRETAKDVLESSRTLEETVVNMNMVAVNTLGAAEQVKRQAAVQDQAIAGVEEVLRVLVETINRVSENVETQASYVEQSSSSITEMTANIRSVSETTQKAEGLALELDSAAHTGSDSIQESLGAIHDIEDAAGEVASIIQTISKISAQTNLLAMNAAIEAAHAGDMGKGFAVVADEVRKLANDSSDSAKAISGKIKAMVQRVSRGVSASEKANQSFNQVTTGVVQTRDLTRAIAQAMTEQKFGAEEILGSVTNLVQATSTISVSAKEQRTHSDEIQEKMSSLHRAFEEISQAVANQELQAQQLKDTVTNLQKIAQSSKLVSDNLESIL